MAAGLRLLGDARRDDRRHRRHGAVYRPSPSGGKRAGRRPRAGGLVPFPRDSLSPLSAAGPRPAPAPEVASPSPVPTATPSPLPTLAPVRLPSIAGAVRPVSGGLLRGFSALPVLWPSLDCWQAHPAVDLGAASGETAVCMRDGVVLSCVRDDLWGWHVAVRQTDGAVCTYSGLSCALVQAGQSVVRGQPLGDVMAAVPAESELGAHLHLSLYRDGEAAEPTLPD